MIDEDSLAGGVNTCFQEQSRQGVTQSTGYNTGFLANDNTFFRRGGNGGNGVPQTPPWIGLDFHCGHSRNSPIYWFSTFVENALSDKIVVDKSCFHCLR